MKDQPRILTISGSDSTGQSGIQSDIKTISAMGGCPFSVVTAITTRDSHEHSDNRVAQIFDVPCDIVIKQTQAICSDLRMDAVKIGLVRGVETIQSIRNQVYGCRRLVVAPGIFSTDGTFLSDDDSIFALMRYVIPEADLLMLRCRDAERMLGMTINSDASMIEAATRFRQMGAKWVMLRGGVHFPGQLISLILGSDADDAHTYTQRFFSSHNTEGWLQKGVSGALSAAITTRLGMNDDVLTALDNAHEYMHSQVVYAQKREGFRPVDIYNQFVTLITEHYAEAHDVRFYADRLAITPRYLTRVTNQISGDTPKDIINKYLTARANVMLKTTRLTLQEVADSLGFKSQARLTEFIKKSTGKSPGEFRFT